MTIIESFPPELFLLVINLLHTKDILSFALASRTFYNFLIPILHRTVQVSPKTVQHIEPLLQKLKNPTMDIASHVRMFSIQLHLMRLQIFDSLPDVLRQMRHLEEYRTEDVAVGWTPAVIAALSTISSIKRITVHLFGADDTSFNLSSVEPIFPSLVEFHVLYSPWVPDGDSDASGREENWANFFSSFIRRHLNTLKHLSILYFLQRQPSWSTVQSCLAGNVIYPQLESLMIPHLWSSLKFPNGNCAIKLPNLRSLSIPPGYESFDRGIDTLPSALALSRIQRVQCLIQQLPWLVPAMPDLTEIRLEEAKFYDDTARFEAAFIIFVSGDDFRPSWSHLWQMFSTSELVQRPLKRLAFPVSGLPFGMFEDIASQPFFRNLEELSIWSSTGCADFKTFRSSSTRALENMPRLHTLLIRCRRRDAWDQAIRFLRRQHDAPGYDGSPDIHSVQKQLVHRWSGRCASLRRVVLCAEWEWLRIDGEWKQRWLKT